MTQQRLSVDSAYQACIEIAQSHQENFPTASLLLPEKMRPAVAAIYAFARTADDIADEGSMASSERMHQLDAWEALLNRCDQQPVEHPIFLALGDTIEKFQLDKDDLVDLLTAFRMDTQMRHYYTWDDLHFYCKHSANPVGRLMLALYGIRDAKALQASDAICTALQLANFWQDLSIDLPRGRCYLPTNLLNQHQITWRELQNDGVDNATFQRLLQQAIAHTQQLFDQGWLLLPMLPWRLRLQISATLHGGLAILAQVRQSTDPLHRRPQLHTRRWIMMTPSIIWRCFSQPSL
ncbi:MAG: squalene synthase HpnC [Zetaproteobacteria bacterium]|nr:squalene synthase HpnC [Zetaproteobacteria bacterium]